MKPIRSTRAIRCLLGCASLAFVFLGPGAPSAKSIGILSVSPTNRLFSSGFIGGPFSPSSQVYVLTNRGTTSLSWAATKSQTWVTLSATNGTLASHATTSVTVSINSNANTLAVGNYSATVTFTNRTNNNGTTSRAVNLAVNGIPVLSVSPSNDFSSSGSTGGPFSPPNQVYSLTNSGSASLTWSASNTQAWLSISPSSGTLAVGAGATVSVSINSSANNLAAGSYSDTVTFTNLTNGNGSTNRAVSLTIILPGVLGVTSVTNACIAVSPTIPQGTYIGSVVAGVQYTFSASGLVLPAWYLPFGDFVDANGSSYGGYPADSSFLCPGLRAYSLVGKVNDACVQLGTGGSFVAPETGGLFLTMNGPLYDYGDECNWWNACLTYPPDMASSGLVGGPFDPPSQVYTLTNTGSLALNWSISSSQNWIDLTATSGTLVAGDSTNITLSINTHANRLPAGVYSNAVTFTNLTTGNGTTAHNVILAVLPHPLDHFEWNVIPSPQRMDTSFPVTVTARDASNNTIPTYTNAVSLSGSVLREVANNTILNSPDYSIAQNNGTYTYGYSFTPSADLTVTAVRQYWTGMVSIWTDDGALLAQGPLAYLLGGHWYEFSLGSPVTLVAGRSYRVGVYTAGEPIFGRNDLPSTFPDGTINQSYWSSGYAFPTIPDGARWWFADLRYTTSITAPVAITPTNSGNFVGGVWTGAVTVLGPATNMWLRADDGAGNSGTSLPFVVQAFTDLAVTMSAAPDPVLVSSNLTWTATVINLGPDGTTGVLLTDPLPPGTTFVLANASQGTCTQIAGIVTCSLGDLGNQAGATATIVVTPVAEGILTNVATISSDGTDTNLANSVATAISAVQGVSVLQSTPSSVLAFTGSIGGPFSPPSQVYSLTNIGTSALGWSANAAQSWLSLSATSGSLLVGQGTNVTVSVNSIANTLAVGSYSNTVTFANLTNGNGTADRIVTLTITTLPAPSNLAAVVVTNNQVNLSWTDNSTGEDGFKIERAPDNAGTPGDWAEIATVSNNVTAYTDPGLTPSTAYWYRVRAFNSQADSDYSNQAGATTLPPPPAAPSGLTAIPLSGSQIALSWTDNATNETGFAIEQAPDSGGSPGTWAQIRTVNPNVTTYTNVGLTANTTYWYRVRASNTGGYSPYSNQANATTLLNLPDSWIDSANGKWETAGSWSLGVPPSVFLLGVLVTNSGSKTVTVDATTVSNFPSTLTISNLTVSAASGATNTLLLNTGGSSTPLHVLRGISLASGGLLDVENSSLQVDSFPTPGPVVGAAIDGMLLFQNGGLITFSNREPQSGGGKIAVGNVATGQMMVAAGTVNAGTLDVGNAAGSLGTLTISGVATVHCSPLVIGGVTNATGTVWMTGGELTTTNAGKQNILYVGNGGTGQMTVSNGTVLSGQVFIGTGIGSRGTLTVAGGNMTISSVLNIGSVSASAGAVWLTGGCIAVTNGPTLVGASGIGQLTTTAGSLQALSIVVGQFAGSQGSLAVSGGTATVWSSLVVGDCATTATGQVTVASGGSLFVTNASHTAFLDVRNGTLVVNNGGVLVADRIIATNGCGRIIRSTGGTIVATTLALDPSLSAVGGGIPNGWKQQYGFDPFDPTADNADPDGDGFTNLQEYLAGTDPTNSVSVFCITSLAATGNDVLVSWMTGIGRTNALQATAGDGSGSYNTNNFTDIFTVTNTDGSVTNYLDPGAVTNSPSRFYRVRLVP
ncbi:MAG: fibronectin type III domain-containing protein [Verrucomicrobiia bacterium]